MSEKQERVCIDCGQKILVSVDECLREVAYLCGAHYSERFDERKFDEMPVTLNFGNSLKLTINERPVRVGVRVYEQTQNGRVDLRRHP